MSELILPGPAPTDKFDPTKGPAWTKNGTNYWDYTKKVGGVDYSKSTNLFGNTNMNCPDDSDDEKFKYVYTTDSKLWTNTKCSYQKVPVGNDVEKKTTEYMWYKLGWDKTRNGRVDIRLYYGPNRFPNTWTKCRWDPGN